MSTTTYLDPDQPLAVTPEKEIIAARKIYISRDDGSVIFQKPPGIGNYEAGRVMHFNEGQQGDIRVSQEVLDSKEGMQKVVFSAEGEVVLGHPLRVDVVGRLTQEKRHPSGPENPDARADYLARLLEENAEIPFTVPEELRAELAQVPPRPLGQVQGGSQRVVQTLVSAAKGLLGGRGS